MNANPIYTVIGCARITIITTICALRDALSIAIAEATWTRCSGRRIDTLANTIDAKICSARVAIIANNTAVSAVIYIREDIYAFIITARLGVAAVI